MNQKFMGFLTDLLFVPWHRPYVALYEQVLVFHAVRIAGQYPPDLLPEYVAAAQTLRHHYWDRASDPTLPPAICESTVTVRAPCGISEIANPLYSYLSQRPAVESGFGGFLATRPHTIRCLGDGSTPSSVTDSNTHMSSIAEDLTSEVYDIFARTKAFDSIGWRVSSFEYPHNRVHMWAVCNRTFSDVNWTAFDPVFMLHHCNLDQLVAMWQVVNSREAIFTVTANSTGRYVTLKITTESADSPLKPFYDQNINFHTSSSVANITTFGYTYPEMPEWKMPPEARAGHARAQVNSLYSRSENLRTYYYTAESS
ncbi:89e97d41-eaa9-4e25-a73e-00cbc5ef496e [Thermothielavioides terrestris]|uniref:89e97d41-eaa9-4e25-a73e-00cbc5ef496e n=1 Tax=Thermothielavioides terrestris TaxID=2587410 RepID=A0A446BWT3_9PEZI|nr:89e97d41-eaa9-4e25-a73e-00cbc5ef496e [Thermothielavioides terrestris]